MIHKFNADKYKENNEFLKSLALVTDLGLVFIAPIIVFTITGHYISKYFNLPKSIIIFFILSGLAISSYMTYKKMKKLL